MPRHNPPIPVVVWIAWAAFVLRGAFYCAAMPLWEGYDEWSHYAYVQYVRVHRSLPNSQFAPSAEITDSFLLAPLPRMLRHFAPPAAIHDQYWQLESEERRRREAEFLAIDPGRALRTGSVERIYEAMQPPLYYWLLSVPDWLARGLHLATRVVILRWLSVLMASTVIPLTYFIARGILSRDLASLACVLTAALPGLAIDVSRVANDSLAMALAAAFLWQSLRSLSRGGKRKAAICGALLGACLLSKAYLLSLAPIPIAVAIGQVTRRKQSSREAAIGCAITLGIAIAIGGWWYWTNLARTGSISGEQVDVAAARIGWGEKLSAFTRVRWLSALDDATFSHIWWGGWSFLGLRSWMYHVVRFLAAMAGVGLLWILAGAIRRAWKRKHLDGFTARVALLTISYALFTAGMVYYTWVVFALTGQSTALGWYWCAMIAVETTLLTLGARAISRSDRAAKSAMVFVTTLFVAVDLYAMHWILIPYYSGLIRFRPNGSLEAWRFSNAVSWSEILSRLSTNKIGWVGSALPALWTLYILATLTLLGLAFRAARRWRRIS